MPNPLKSFLAEARTYNRFEWCLFVLVVASLAQTALGFYIIFR